MVPMQAQERKEALHEPQSRAGVSPAPVGNADGMEPLTLARSPGKLDSSSVAVLRRLEACPTLASVQFTVSMRGPVTMIAIDRPARAERVTHSANKLPEWRRDSWRSTVALLLAWCLLAQLASAQNSSEPTEALSAERFKSGAATLEACAPVAGRTRHSVVKLDVDGNTVALAAVIDAHGLALTKASEIKNGKLTAWRAGGKEVDAELIGVDEENDVALLKVHAEGLKPVEWSSEEVSVGQWAVTPGIEATPQAAGIVSVPPRKILHKRALMGVQLDFHSSNARIAQIIAGMGADKAGLKSGDVILAVNDTPVNNREELTTTLRNFREGQSVKLRVRREEEEFDAEVVMMVPAPEALGRGFDRQERMNRLGGEPSERAEGFDLAIQHDTALQPWQCGGPLVDLEGKAIGLNIARAGRVASYALPAELVKRIAESLKRQAEANLKDKATIETSHPPTPAIRK